MRRWGKSVSGEILGSLLFFSLAGSAAFTLARYTNQTAAEALYKVHGDYLLMTVQCALAIAAMALPVLLEKRMQLQLPPYLYALYYAFLFCAVFLGEILAFYYLVPHWDTLLHFFSGLMLGLVGGVLARAMNRSAAVQPLLLAAFAFCFSLAAGAVWEIYEYVMDGLLHMNMQKFADSAMQVYAGRAALFDTMKDILTDAAAALLAAAGCFAQAKRQG